MKRIYKEPDIEILKYSLRDDIATAGLISGTDWGEINLDGGYPAEVEF